MKPIHTRHLKRSLTANLRLASQDSYITVILEMKTWRDREPGFREKSKEAQPPSGLRLKRGLRLVERKGHRDICRRKVQDSTTEMTPNSLILQVRRQRRGSWAGEPVWKAEVGAKREKTLSWRQQRSGCTEEG